jgi:hypothetical protein
VKRLNLGGGVSLEVDGCVVVLVVVDGVVVEGIVVRTVVVVVGIVQLIPVETHWSASRREQLQVPHVLEHLTRIQKGFVSPKIEFSFIINKIISSIFLSNITKSFNVTYTLQQLPKNSTNHADPCILLHLIAI